MISTFYNDLFAFDMERRRWYKLGIKQKKEQLSKQAKAEARRLRQAEKKSGIDGEEEEQDDAEESDDEEDNEIEDNIILSKSGERLTGVKVNDKDLFGYIDETGNVVYINIEDELGLEAAMENVQLEKADNSPLQETSNTVVEESTSLTDITPEILPADDNKLRVTIEEPVKAIVEVEKQEEGETAVSSIILPTTDLEKSTFFGRYFEDQHLPCSRINPCLMTR